MTHNDQEKGIMSEAAPSNVGDLDLEAIFQDAADEGDLSGASMAALNINDIGMQLQNGLGVDLGASLQTSEVYLLTIMVDDSGSIRFAGNTEACREGTNAVIEAVTESKQAGGVQAHVVLLNGDVICPFTNIEQAVKLTAANYNPNKGTPLYDQTVAVLGTVIAQAKIYEDQGISVRTMTVIVTDGDDVHSMKKTARDCKAVVEDMRRMEKHVVCGVGIKDDHGVDYTAVFRDMGIPDEWILTPASDPSEIRKAMGVVSQSAVRASQASQGNFSASMLGGFGS